MCMGLSGQICQQHAAAMQQCSAVAHKDGRLKASSTGVLSASNLQSWRRQRWRSSPPVLSLAQADQVWVQLPALACCCCPGPGSGSSAAYLLHNHQQPPGQGHETGASLCTACCCRTVAAFPGACVNTTTSNHWVRALSVAHLFAQHAMLAELLRSSTW